jgi:hypothetical protein
MRAVSADRRRRSIIPRILNYRAIVPSFTIRRDPMTFQNTVADDSPHLLPTVAPFLATVKAVKFQPCSKDERRGIQLTGDDSFHRGAVAHEGFSELRRVSEFAD